MSNVDASTDKPRTGAREWSASSVNIGRGCSHGCIYCYARASALQNQFITGPEEWTTEVVDQAALARNFGKRSGVVMFPTIHDVTDAYLESSIVVLRKLLEAGNEVLVVTKAHLHCVERLCLEFANFKDRLRLRFTIGSLDADLCKFWEPNAPAPSERLAALKYAYALGFSTSVSSEPMLAGRHEAVRLFNAVKHYVVDEVWFGVMNDVDHRVLELADDADVDVVEVVNQLKFLQSDESVLKLYAALAHEPKVAWKDSIKAIVDRSR